MNEAIENRIKQWKRVIAVSEIGAALTIVAAIGTMNSGFSFPRYLLGLILIGVAAQVCNALWQIKRLRRKA